VHTPRCFIESKITQYVVENKTPHRLQDTGYWTQAAGLAIMGGGNDRNTT